MTLDSLLAVRNERLKTIKTVQVTHVSLTAQDWALYYVSEPEGSAEAAESLNYHLKVVANGGADKHKARLTMKHFMKDFVELGALDSEAISALEDILETIYGA